MKNLIKVFLCAGLLMFLTGCSFSCDFGDDPVTNGTEEEANRYEGNGFAVNYPADWIYEEPEEHIVIFSGQEGTEANSATVNIQTMQWGLAYHTFSEFYEDYKSQIEGEGGMISDLGREDFIQDGVQYDSAGFTAEYTMEGVQFVQLVIALDRGDDYFYQLSYTAPHDIFQKYEDEAMYILDNLKLLDVEP